VEEFLAAHPLESDLERERAIAILARVDAAAGGSCPACGAALLGRDVVESIVLGHQDAPSCHSCLAAGHGEDPAAFLIRMREYVDRVPCFRATWLWCGARDDGGAATGPSRSRWSG
jgi:hypothetical protein